jgi:hypothetical protein
LKKEKGDEHLEMVGVFSDGNAFEAAAIDLLNSGFRKKDISLLASEKAVVAELGHAYKRVEDIEDTPWLPKAAYVPAEHRRVTEGILFSALFILGAIAATGAVVLAGGPLSLKIVSGMFGAEIGGLIGGALGQSIEQWHAESLEEHLSHGGLLLWVRIRNEDQEKVAREIFTRHSGRDIHVFTLPTTAN